LNGLGTKESQPFQPGRPAYSPKTTSLKSTREGLFSLNAVGCSKRLKEKGRSPKRPRDDRDARKSKEEVSVIVIQKTLAVSEK